MKFKKLPAFFLVFIITAVLSCDIINWGGGLKYSTGHFPDDPVNLTEFNTEYDDYNSDIPYFGETFPLCFSSNRNSNGGDYDIIYKLMSVEFSRKSGKMKFGVGNQSHLDVYIKNANIAEALTKINTRYDEFGPCLIPVGDGNQPNGSGSISFQNYILLYANNESGDHNIRLTHNLVTNSYDTIINLDYMNSAANDFYPALDVERRHIYWSSDREGDYSIYATQLNQSDNILSDILNSGENSIVKVAILSSEGDDKCPSVTNNIMVFSSNRPGGYGGFDLYYSCYENGSWSQPVNFGSTINSEYDEYRPIVRSHPWHFDNDMMLFSSNRPGGKGGFDLYCVGIARN